MSLLRPETDEQFRARMEAKAARQRYFAELDQRAATAVPPKPKATPKPKAAPKPEATPKPKAARQPRQKREQSGRRVLPWNGQPLPCKGTCGRMLRPPGVTVEQMPNAVRHDSHQMCQTCRKDRPRRLKMPPNCAQCGVELYARRQAPRPGARRHSGRGLCTACYSERARRQGA